MGENEIYYECARNSHKYEEFQRRQGKVRCVCIHTHTHTHTYPGLKRRKWGSETSRESKVLHSKIQS